MSAATLSLAPSNGRGLQLTSLDDMMRFAQIVVTSGLAPSSFQTAEQVVIAVITGMELGISAMQSLQGLAVTNGRIGIMGDLALALCEASPECEDVIEAWSGQEMADDWTCTITVKRKGREPRTGSFSVREARLARLWGKTSRDGKPSPWVLYPQRMIRYRALGFALRDAFPHVLKGVKTVEELQDYPEEAKNGFSHAKPVEGSVIEGQDQPPSRQPLPKAPERNGHADNQQPAAPSDHQTITGIIERAWPNDYQGKRYYFAKVNGQQLQTTEQEVGEALITQVGKEIRAAVDPSPKPGKWYLKAFEPTEPAAPAAEPSAPKVIENPGMEAVARRAAAKAKHEAKDKPAEAPASHDGIRMERTPYDEVCERMAAMHPPLKEYWLLAAAKRLGWIQPTTRRLADMDATALGVLLVRWTDLVEAARREERGTEEEASPAAN